MSKHKGEQQQEQPVKQNPFDGAKNKKDAIRLIREKLRNDRGGEDVKPADIYEEYQHTKWSVKDRTKDLNTINTNLTGLRKEEGTAGTGRRGRHSAKEDQSEPTLSDLLRVKEQAKEQGGVEAMAEQVAKVAEWAKEFGGVENLNRCLDALRQLSGD